MGLVDDRVGPWDARAAVVAPREGVVDHHRLGDVGGRCRGRHGRDRRRPRDSQTLTDPSQPCRRWPARRGR
jgi:hypothetical protein